MLMIILRGLYLNPSEKSPIHNPNESDKKNYPEKKSMIQEKL